MIEDAGIDQQDTSETLRLDYWLHLSTPLHHGNCLLDSDP